MKIQMLSHSELASLCQELALLLHAGVDTGGALTLMYEQTNSPSHQALLRTMSQQADSGHPLAAVFQNSGCFPRTVCVLVEVGERTGCLDETLTALATYHQRRADLDRYLRSALLYPAIPLMLMLVVIVVLLTQVLPVFNDVYGYLGGRLTGFAGSLLTVGHVLNRALPFLGVLLCVGVLCALAFACSYTLRQHLAALWRKTRGDTGISKALNAARFAQALSMGLSSGLPTEEALQLASTLFEDLPSTQQRCDKCLEQLALGDPLAKALGDQDLLPPTQCRLLDLATRSGSGDQAMIQIAQRLSEESEAALEARLGQIEPTLVICCSLLVGLILLSVMLPLMHIMSAIG